MLLIHGVWILVSNETNESLRASRRPLEKECVGRMVARVCGLREVIFHTEDKSGLGDNLARAQSHPF